MPEQRSAEAMSSQVRANVRELTELMREGHPLDPGVRQQLADLVAELSELAGRSDVPSEEVAQLVDSATTLVRSLRQQHEPGVLEAARERLQEAIYRAEAHAPTATLLARQVIETLANLGI